MKKLLALSLIFVLVGAFAITTGGKDVTVAIQSVKPVIKAGETGSFDIIVHSNEATDLNSYIFISGAYPAWIQTYEYLFTIPAHGDKRITVKITPTPEAARGDYKFDVTAQVKSGDKWDDVQPPASMILTVAQAPEPVASVTVSMYTDKAIYSPSDSIKAAVELKQFRQQFSTVEVEFRLLDVSKTQSYSYRMPVTDRTEPIVLIHEIPLSIRTFPGDYSVVADVYSETGKIGTAAVPISVKLFEKPKLDRTQQVNLFSKTIKLVLENEGNSVLAGELKEEVNWYERFLVTATPQAQQTGDSGKYYVIWTYSGLQPGQRSAEYTYTVSYLPIYLAAILVVLVAYALWRGVRSVTVTKEVIKQRIGQNSLEAVMSVTIKNHMDKIIKDVVLTDNIPQLAAAEAFGTVHPTKVEKHRAGTTIEWEFGSFSPHEERVVTYKIRTTFGVLGTIDIPAAVVRFTTPDGSRQGTRSNTTECGRTA